MPLSKLIQFHECKQVNGANPPLPAAVVRRGTVRAIALWAAPMPDVCRARLYKIAKPSAASECQRLCLIP
jgi:hypothetical protein